MRNQLIHRIGKILREGEVALAIEELLSSYREESLEYTQIISISCAYEDLKKLHIKNSIKYDDYLIERNKIVDGILTLAKEHLPEENLNPTIEHPVSNLLYTDNMARSNRFFHAESDYMKQLLNLVFDLNRAIKITAIYGMPGVGKTFLVNRLGNQLLDNGSFKYVWLFDSDSYENITNDFKELATVLGIHDGQKDDKLIDDVKTYLDEEIDDWLLIFDNACDEGSSIGAPDFFARKFFPVNLSIKKQIVVTSTNRAWKMLFLSDIGFEIQPWSANDFHDFLVKRGVKSNLTASYNLHYQFEGLPLAIDQAADYIDRSQIEIKTFLGLLKENKKKLLEKGISLLKYPKGNMINAIILSFEKLENFLPVQAQSLMGIISFLYSFNIPLISISQRLIDYQHTNKKIDAFSNNPLYDLDDCISALSVLIQYSLLRKSGEETYSVHQLIKEGIQFYIKEDSEKFATLQNEVLELLYISYYPEGHFYQYLSSYMVLMTPHVISVIDNIQSHDTIKKENRYKYLILFFRLFLYHDALGERQTGLKHLDKFEKLVGEDADLAHHEEIQVAMRIIKLKACYPARLIPLSTEQKTEVEILSDHLDFFSSKGLHDWSVVCLNRLGLTMLRNKSVDEAISFFEQALSFDNTFDFLHGNLGVCYFEKGEIEKAIDLLTRSNLIAHNNKNQYPIAVNNITLATIMILQGNMKLAKDILFKTISSFQRLNEKRFLAYALYLKILFDLDEDIVIQQDLKQFNELAPSLNGDLKYRILSEILHLKIAIEDGDKNLVLDRYKIIKRSIEMYKFYINECLIAYTLLKVTIFFSNSDEPILARESLSNTKNFVQEMSLFPFSKSLQQYSELLSTSSI